MITICLTSIKFLSQLVLIIIWEFRSCKGLTVPNPSIVAHVLGVVYQYTMMTTDTVCMTDILIDIKPDLVLL